MKTQLGWNKIDIFPSFPPLFSRVQLQNRHFEFRFGVAEATPHGQKSRRESAGA